MPKVARNISIGIVLSAFMAAGVAACTSSVPEPTPDVQAAVEAAVAKALPTATPTPTPDIDATVSAAIVATKAAAPTAIPVPTPTFTPSPTPDIDATVQAAIAATAAANPTVTPTATPAPTSTPTPEPTPTPVPPPTPAPTPTTIAATATPATTVMPAATAVPAPTAMPAQPTATAMAMMEPANPERYGGNLTVSLGAAISTLDVHRTTGTTANTIAYAVQEFLFAYNEQLQAQPLLIDTWETSSDGSTWTFKLRDGLKFHNEKAVTSEDAVQSWIRWAERDNYGSLIFGFIDDIYTAGDLTFQIDMVEPTALVLEGMARIGGYYPYIMPPEMYNVPAADGANVLIGTGPYKYAEWIPGDHLLVERFEDYLPVKGEFSFMAGKKVAYFDTVDYVVVPDTNARIAALRTGEIDVIDGAIPSDFVDTLAEDANLTVEIFTNNSTRDGAWIDNIDGPFADGAIRRAFAMAYPVEDALRAAVGDERFWDLCPSMMVCGGNKWGGFDDFSDDIYNARGTAGSDGLSGLERAKQIVEDKGLVGTPIIVLQAADRPRFAGPAEISRQVLEELGFDVEFKVTDWATQINWREKPWLWDVYHTAGGGAWGTNPLLNSSLANNKYWNRYQDESGRMTALTQDLARATSADEQLQIVKDMQEVFWNDIPYVSFGDTYWAAAYRADLEGVKKFRGQPFNVFNSWRP